MLYHMQHGIRSMPPTRPVLAVSLLLFSLAVGGPQPAHAEQSAPARLEELRKRIQDLAASIGAGEARRDSVSSELRDSELRVAATREELARIDIELGNARDAVAALEQERALQQAALEQQREALAREVRVSYLLLRVDYLHVLLGQQDPSTVARARAFHRYVTRARAERLASLRETLDAVLHVHAETAEHQARLLALQTRQSAALEELRQRQAARSAALERIEADLGERDARLQRLQQYEKALAELVGGLEREMAALAPADSEIRPFATLRGKLPWPAPGSIVQRFGTPRGDTTLTWQGVLIRAEGGTPVQAVSSGRIAFADWLRGFGLLVIVDHGDGYMSLYGHNRSLARTTGDWVAAGETIGSVGDSGGQDAAGLYFEIRHKGAPQDPVRWLGRSLAGAG